MDMYVEPYDDNNYIITSPGNKVCREAMLCGSQRVNTAGLSILEGNSMVRADLAPIHFGQYCVIRKDAVIRPAFKHFQRGSAFFTSLIGDHVYIGEGSVVNAAQIGSYVHIGKNCVIGKRCVIKDCCQIANNSVLPPDTVVATFTLYGGNPAKPIGDLPESTEYLMTDATMQFYKRFVPK